MKCGVVRLSTVMRQKGTPLRASYYVDHTGPARVELEAALRQQKRARLRVRRARAALRTAERRQRQLLQDPGIALVSDPTDGA